MPRNPTNKVRRTPRIRSISETVAYEFTSRTYPCTTCGKRFHSPQALGGHQNGHSRDRRFVEEYMLPGRSAPKQPSSASNEVSPHDPKPAQVSAGRDDLTPPASSNSKGKGAAPPDLSSASNDPSPVVNNAVPPASPMPASPLCFDPKGKKVLMTFSPSFPSTVYDPRGKAVLETSASPVEYLFFPDSNTAGSLWNPNTVASLWNPNPAARYLVPCSDACFGMGEQLLMPGRDHGPRPSGGGNSGGKVTKNLLGALARRRGAPGGGEEPNPMELDLELHL